MPSASRASHDKRPKGDGVPTRQKPSQRAQIALAALALQRQRSKHRVGSRRRVPENRISVTPDGIREPKSFSWLSSMERSFRAHFARDAASTEGYVMTQAAHLEAASASRRDPVHQAYQLLHWGFVSAP